MFVFVTATSAHAYKSATKMACVGGRITCIGMPAVGTAFVGGDPMLMMLKSRKIISTLTSYLKDTSDAL